MCRCDDEGVEVPWTVTVAADGSYTVTTPILPELAAHGKTPEDALEKAHANPVAILNRYEEMGKQLPPHFH